MKLTRMRNGSALVALGLVASTLALAACGSSGSGSTNTTGSKSQKSADVALLSYVNNEYTQVWLDGLSSTVKPSGGSASMFNANFDAQKQMQQCLDAITSKRFNSIVLAAVSGVVTAPCIRAAKAAKMPVVALDTPIGPDPDEVKPQVDGVVGSIVVSGRRHGVVLWPILEQACGSADPCRVIIEIAAPTDPFGGALLKYLRAQADASGGKVQIVSVLTGNYDAAQTAKNIPDALSAHKDANVAILEADNNAVVALDAIKNAGREGKITVIGYGGSVEGGKAVADGRIYATFSDWPRSAGALAGRMVLDSLNGKAISPNGVFSRTLGKPIVVDQSTASQFQAQWPAQK
jgi:ribose transport system substrate-binding protein